MIFEPERRLRTWAFAAGAAFVAAPASLAQWVDYVDDTASRISADAALVVGDLDEKDYAWGDVDLDGDVDLVVVRKEPNTTAGKRRNVLLINEDGVLTDRTGEFATASDVVGDQGFLTPTNDRDVVLVDIDNDGWIDVVTAAAVSDGEPKHIGHPRVYVNLGCTGACAGTDDWSGFRYEDARIPELLTGAGEAGFNPRFAGVAAGDVNGDGYVDLYFSDHDDSGAAGGVDESFDADFDDRLLLNLGESLPGHFTDVTAEAFSGLVDFPDDPDQPFPRSDFGGSAVIVDLNGDSASDIVKQSAFGAQFVAVAYGDTSIPGAFEDYDVLFTEAPSFVAEGDFDADGKRDLVITSDGYDRFLMNGGNGANGKALMQIRAFSFRHEGDGGPAADDGFVGNAVTADLDRDGWDDVLTASVHDDIPSCARRTHLYRNLGMPGNGEGETVLEEQTAGSHCEPFWQDPPTCLVSGIPSDSLEGTHDIAVLDINGDTWLDLVLGKCSGTSVLINLPPAPPAGPVPDGHTVAGEPLRLGKAPGGLISLTWGESCVAADSDYSVYAGTLGRTFSDHSPLTCSTFGATSRDVVAPAHDAYFIVVPHNGVLEGSYGVDSSGTAREPVPPSCRAQYFQHCN